MMPWRLRLLLLFATRADGQTRAAVLGCVGQSRGTRCRFEPPQLAGSSVASDGSQATPPTVAVTVGHCFMLDTWEDGSGGVYDLDGQGQARVSKLVCLEDGTFFDAEGSAAAQAARIVPGSQAANATAATSESPLQVSGLLEWVVGGGGWQILVGCSTVLCLCLAVGIAVIARCFSGDEQETYVGWLPRSAAGTTSTRSKIPWRYNNNSASMPWKRVYSRKVGSAGTGRKMPKGAALGRSSAADAEKTKPLPKGRSSGSKSVPSSRRPEDAGARLSYDIEAELRAAAFEDAGDADEAILPSLHRGSALRLPEAAVPRLQHPPRPISPMNGDGADARGVLLLSPATPLRSQQPQGGLHLLDMSPLEDPTPGTCKSTTALIPPSGRTGQQDAFRSATDVEARLKAAVVLSARGRRGNATSDRSERLAAARSAGPPPAPLAQSRASRVSDDSGAEEAQPPPWARPSRSRKSEASGSEDDRPMPWAEASRPVPNSSSDSSDSSDSSETDSREHKETQPLKQSAKATSAASKWDAMDEELCQTLEDDLGQGVTSFLVSGSVASRGSRGRGSSRSRSHSRSLPGRSRGGSRAGSSGNNSKSPHSNTSRSSSRYVPKMSNL
ncbi:unnamed protein product [Polarella glacialis]|uniref:Uncharacterized protein n=1 Tax=Polarella glacialis TaxID=89957 RepID=A0A813GUE3_POLGL|nr:unnamed protein product [Polarella glacialis]